MIESAVKFCQNILPQVSRSFALTIPMLDEDLYLPVLITYLQDRLLDSFEDEIKDEDVSLTKRLELMDKVVELFNPDNEQPEIVWNELRKYASLMPKKPLKELTNKAILIRRAYETLENKIKQTSYKWLKEMNRGMKKYLNHEVNTFADLDEYCYFVAGTVGGFLTETIILMRDLSDDAQNSLLNNFKDAGLFLQKINLVRDIKYDFQELNKAYWPLESLDITAEALLDPFNEEKSMAVLDIMIINIRSHVCSLITYLEALPESLAGYRKFFCVNNALGLATIKKMENNSAIFYGQKPVKVSKIDFLKILKSPEKNFYELAMDLQNV